MKQSQSSKDSDSVKSSNSNLEAKDTNGILRLGFYISGLNHDFNASMILVLVSDYSVRIFSLQGEERRG